MKRLMTRAVRLACAALVSLVAAACGGGGGSETSPSGAQEASPAISKALAVSVSAASASSPTLSKTVALTTVNAEGPATTLILRAHGVIAGGVGPIVRVLVDGVEAGTAEVTSTTPQDIRIPVPALRAGMKLDIVYTNDATVGGVDRNLFISQITAGDTYVLPSSSIVTLDRGDGAEALDGINTGPGQSALWSNGALRMVWPEPNMTDRLTVRASGKSSGGSPPLMSLVVDGIHAGQTAVTSSDRADYTFAVPRLKIGSRVEVVGINLGMQEGQTRSMDVAYIKSDTTVLQPTATNAVFDAGAGAAAFDGINTQPGSSALSASGALRVKWPAANMSEMLTVRAGGTSTDNVYPRMEVRVNGVVLGTVELVSASPSDYTLATLPISSGSLVEAVLANADGTNSATRTIKVRQAISGKTYLLAQEAELRGNWPSTNLTDTLTINAAGTLAGDVGPVMQVYVDGLFLGQAEVRASTSSDYSFLAPAMDAGRKVEIVYVNDAIVGGVDRNLFVAYAISGRTSFVPGTPGAVFDRGTADAAFDERDITSASKNLYNNGALRITWPAANITESVVVRASGVLAGNVGALLQLRVDGVIVSSVEVRASELTDYVLAVPSLKAGTRIETLFANPGQVDGVERSLTIAYLKTSDTVLVVEAKQDLAKASLGSYVWPASNLNETLTVRAYGTLAGNVGPMMQVRVDGVVLGSVEVRSAAPADYSFAAPSIKEGSKVDVVFTNDAYINGQDRNLFVNYVISGQTVLRATSANMVYDRGTGQAAFDGLEVSAGGTTMGWNGALRGTWPAPSLTEKLTVHATSTVVDGVGAAVELRVDGVVMGRAEFNSSEPTDLVFPAPRLARDSRVDLVATNLGTTGDKQRRLSVAYLLSGNTVVKPEVGSHTFDKGDGEAAFDGTNVAAASTDIRENGALRIRWSDPNMTESIVIGAAGSMADGVGPIMKLRVDGVIVGSAEVRSTLPAEYTFATTPIKSGTQVDVVYDNDAIVKGEDRNLTIGYLRSGLTSVLPSASTVKFDQGSGLAAFDGVGVTPGKPLLSVNGALRTVWPEANMTSTITVRARADLAGGIGAQMQVHVDGVMVGTTEVKSTQFADFTFATTPILPGGRVDVVYTNDASINGVDRNLYVAYAVSDRTYVLPVSSAARYDRGAGLAAFDGVDVIPGQGAMSWSGALRMTWPTPNITDTLTVRASGTLAGNVGPLMQVRVDGIVVSSVEVRAQTPTDYLMPVPPLRQGSKIDVVYVNDDNINGADRNLTVAYLIGGKTFIRADAADVKLDRGSGNAAFDGLDVSQGQPLMALNGALRFTWPAPNLVDTVTVRASASLANNVGALMQLRVDGVIVGTVEVRSTTPADYVFAVPRLATGSQVDVVYINDATIDGQDRNLFVQYINAGGVTVVPWASGVSLDKGVGEFAFDGVDAVSSDGALYGPSALRFKLPTLPSADKTRAARYAASRFLQQATFGPTTSDIERLATGSPATWIAEQMAIPAKPDFVNFVQSKFDLGDAYRPNGTNYTAGWVGQAFWQTAATSPDQLRKRVAFALHKIVMVSQADSNLHYHSRAYANYLDILNKHAFGNYRNLLEDIALSPAMGIYLSHMRNRAEDPVSGRLPDENFAREIMQLFTIGLHELNIDGSVKLDSQGQPIETYSIADVMAMAKVFTGWSWAFPDSQLTEATFRYGAFDYSSAKDQRIDLQRMKAYPGQHSLSEKRLFAGKPNAVVIPANTGASDSLRIALDALFNHPNVGPFIGRQLIQQLVTSNPTPAYVARVAAAFNNNGAGVRGDLAAVVRAVLLDSEARTPPSNSLGKLREPVMRVTHWMRSFSAVSKSGEYLMAYELDNQSQRALNAPSVFGYFRPGFVPPNTSFSANNITVPEFQIVSESTTSEWVNTAMAMTTSGLGWNGSSKDVSASLDALVAIAAANDVDGLIERLNLLLYAGQMSAGLRQDLVDAITGVPGTTAASSLNRARVALFLALASPEYLVQR